jgi:Mrp family chromosome partitioning ATPase/capsular polysaccharide biosynthesis protein
VELPPASGGELGDFVKALRRQAWVLVLVFALVMAAGTALVMRRSATWTSTASLLVPAATNEGGGARGDSVVDLNTERQVLRSHTVAAVVAERLDGAGVGLDDADGEDLIGRVAVEVPVDTRVLRVTVTGDSAKQARAVARAFLSSYRDLAYLNAVGDRNTLLEVVDEELETADEDLEDVNEAMASAPAGSAEALEARSRREVVTDHITSLEERRAELLGTAVPAVRVLSAASEGTTTDEDIPVRDLALVVLAGLVLGAVAAIARDRFDDRLRDVDAFEEALGAPVLATIPTTSKSDSDVTRLVVVDDPTGAAAEAYRQLRVGVLGSPEVPGGTILLAGVRGGEGASAVTANLAMAMAATGRSVAVVVIDDERPGVAARFDVDGPGLAEVLSGELALADAVRRPRWLPVSVLPRGGGGVSVRDLLQSEAMHRLHRTLLSETDFVFLAAPPVLTAADAVALSSMADAAVVVATPLRTARRDLRAARSKLSRVGFPVLGSVLHGAVPPPRKDKRRPDDDPQQAPPAASSDEEADEEAPVEVGAPN